MTPLRARVAEVQLAVMLLTRLPAGRMAEAPPIGAAQHHGGQADVQGHLGHQVGRRQQYPAACAQARACARALTTTQRAQKAARVPGTSGLRR